MTLRSQARTGRRGHEPSGALSGLAYEGQELLLVWPIGRGVGQAVVLLPKRHNAIRAGIALKKFTSAPLKTAPVTDYFHAGK